jgi:hypothetical protein
MEESNLDLTAVQCEYMLGGAEENHEKLRIVSVLAKI